MTDHNCVSYNGIMTEKDTAETTLERGRMSLADIETMQHVVEMKIKLNYTNAQIAEKLFISVGYVNRYIRLSKKHYMEKIEQDLGEQRAVMIAELEVIKREAWESWVQSKNVAESVERVVELGDLEDNEREFVSAVVTKLRRNSGNPKYLKVIQDSIKQESDLLGLQIKRAATTNDRGERITAEERKERIIDIIDRAKERRIAIEEEDDRIVESG